MPDELDFATPLIPMGREWVAQAECRGAPIEWFFPPRGGTGGRLKGRALCAVCPVQAECEEWARSAPEPFGLWGGLTEKERRSKRIPICHNCGSRFERPTRHTRLCEPCSDDRRRETWRAYHAERKLRETA